MSGAPVNAALGPRRFPRSIIGRRHFLDAPITLRVYAHWLAEASNEKLVDSLDDVAPRGPQTAPDGFTEDDPIALRAVGKNGEPHWNRTIPTTRVLPIHKLTRGSGM